MFRMKSITLFLAIIILSGGIAWAQENKEEIIDSLPGPLSGWKVNSDIGTALYPAICKQYIKQNAAVGIGIMQVFKDPAEASMWKENNNAILKMLGGKEITVKENYAILRETAPKLWDMVILVKDKILVSINGIECDKSDVQAYAEEIDYDALLPYFSE
ncbi:MAG: hypothetical protein WC569_02795 [Candidatus Omnitrophota bacterium]